MNQMSTVTMFEIILELFLFLYVDSHIYKKKNEMDDQLKWIAASNEEFGSENVGEALHSWGSK